MNYYEIGPKVVLIHDIGHSDFAPVLKSAGIEAPCSIMSFTELGKKYNPHNSRLLDAAEDADVLFLPKSGLNSQSFDVMLAFRATLRSPNRIRQIVHYTYDNSTDDGYFNCFEKFLMMEDMKRTMP